MTADTRRQDTVPETAGSPWLAELYRRFAPVREDAIEAGYREEEINDAIEEAVAAVRSAHALRQPRRES
jgi:hypothetical protein